MIPVKTYKPGELYPCEGNRQLLQGMKPQSDNAMHVSKSFTSPQGGAPNRSNGCEGHRGASPQIIFAKKKFCKKPYSSDEKTKGEHNAKILSIYTVPMP
jgi:hypothetical protein